VIARPSLAHFLPVRALVNAQGHAGSSVHCGLPVVNSAALARPPCRGQLSSGRAPLLALDVTGRCNLRCVHCYNAEYLPCELPRADVDALLERTPPEWKVYLLGGEPLLRADILDVLARSSALGHPTALATNGVLVKRVGAERLLDTGLQEIYVSLDGADAAANDAIRGRGSFAGAVEGLLALEQAAQGRDVSLNVSSTVCRGNVESVSRLPALVDALGIHVDKLGVMPMSPIGRGAADPGLRVDELTWLDLCETLCADWRRSRRTAFLCMANSELAVRYLEARHHVFLNECVADCRIVRGTDACRVLADGRVVPCSGRIDLIERMADEGAPVIMPVGRLGAGGDQAVPFPAFIAEMQPHLQLGDPLCGPCLYHDECQVCPLEMRFHAAPRMSRRAVCAEVSRRVLDQGITLATSESPVEPPAEPPLAGGDVVVDSTVYVRELRGDRHMLVAPRDQSYHVMDRPGAEFWRALVDTGRMGAATAGYLRHAASPVSGIRRLRHLVRTLVEASALSEPPC
jgi:MoaA/NifB/PqqE/SkfB family radical SAM enzyme